MSGKALVTGASGGIGLEIAKILAREGHDLFLIARNETKLKSISEELSKAYNIKAEYLSADLSDIGSLDRLPEITGNVEILINNAGFGDYGVFAESDWSKQDEMIRLNDLSLAKMTHMYLPAMISAGKGRILNVASVAAFQPGPLMSVYYASKSFVLSFTESLSVELKGTGVSVTALCPGPVNTGFSAAANATDVKLFRKSSGADATKVAEYAVKSLKKGRVVAVYGIMFKLGIFFERLLPRGVIRKLLYLIQRSRTH